MDVPGDKEIAIMTAIAAESNREAVAEDAILKPPGFSWSAASGAAVITVGVTIALLVLGSGIGLVLLPNDQAHPGALTLGAIFFFASQAFGMAVGGHVVGRLIGPAVETTNEENFRAGAHGLAVWALAILITLGLVAATGALANSTSFSLARLYGSSPRVATQDTESTTAYLVDLLFRPQANPNANPQHASLDYAQFAQATNPNQGTDATQGGPPQQDQSNGSPTQLQQPYGTPNGMPNEGAEEPGGESNMPFTTEQPNPSEPPRPRAPQTSPGDLEPRALAPQVANPTQLAADKAEVGRILDAAAAHGGALSVDDRDRVAQLVAQDANVSYEAATSRANDALARMQSLKNDTAKMARAIGSYVSLWLAASLIFGAVIAVIAAISARWEDDIQEMFLLRRLIRQ